MIPIFDKDILILLFLTVENVSGGTVTKAYHQHERDGLGNEYFIAVWIDEIVKG